MTVVSPFLTFPNISWWMQAIHAGEIVLDTAEHYNKMSYRNRYRINGSNNSILLTIPLENGREQRTAMKNVRIYNKERWQVQHWRTLVSVYKRSPFFEFYEPMLQPLFEKEFDLLVDFNEQALSWTMKQLRLNIPITKTEEYVREYAAGTLDLRKDIPEPQQFPAYYQVFEDRIGFQSNLSILDLLFSEGPAARRILE